MSPAADAIFVAVALLLCSNALALSSALGNESAESTTEPTTPTTTESTTSTAPADEAEDEDELSSACDDGIIYLSARTYTRMVLIVEDCVLVGIPGTVLAAPIVFNKHAELNGTLVFDTGSFAWNEPCVNAGGSLTLNGDIVFRNCYNPELGGAIRSMTWNMRNGINAVGLVAQFAGRLLFENCSAKLGGGAIAAQGIELHGEEVTFLNCRAPEGQGGAIYSQYGVDMSAKRVAFWLCSAVTGSAIWSDSHLVLRGPSVEVTRCHCKGKKGSATSVLRAGFRQRTMLVDMDVFTSSCSYGLIATGAFSLVIRNTTFSFLNRGAIQADFVLELDIIHSRMEHMQQFLQARSARKVSLAGLDLFCTPVSPTRCIDLNFWTSGAEIAISDVQIRHRVVSLHSGDAMLLQYPVSTSWADREFEAKLTCSAGSYPDVTLEDQDHWEVKTVPEQKIHTLDCSTLVPGGCCITAPGTGGPGHVIQHSVHMTDRPCSESFPCLCMDAFCNQCTVRTRMKVLRARCADCSYGSLSPVPISMMMEQQHMQLNTGRWHWQKNYCNDCNLVQESVESIISCGKGTMVLPRGIMVTLHPMPAIPDRQTILAWRCPNPGACPGHKQELGLEGLTRQCAPGYAEGIPGCVQCAPGYGRKVNDPFICQQCPPRRFQWSMLALKHAGLFVLGLISARKASRRRTSVIFKIMVSFGTAANCILQAVSSLSEYQLAKNSIRRYLGLTETLTSGTSLYNLLSYECLLQTTRVPEYGWVIIGLVPPLLLLFSCWIVGSIASRYGFRHDILMLQATLVLGNNYMGSACASFMKPLSCFQMQKSVGGHKPHFFCSFTLGPCRSLQFQATAAIGIFVLILAVPMYWLEMIRRSHSWRPEARRQSMGFLISGYRMSVEWWEVVPLLRKVCLLQVRVFFPPSYAASTNLALTLGILMGSLTLHAFVQPYEDSFLNRIEGSTLAASCISLLLASLAVATEWNKNETVTLRYLVLLTFVLASSSVVLFALLARSFIQQVAQKRRRQIGLTLEMERCPSRAMTMTSATMSDMTMSDWPLGSELTPPSLTEQDNEQDKVQ